LTDRLGYYFDVSTPTVISTRALFVQLVAIIIGTFMVILDNTVVNVALTTLGHVFATDLTLLQWVVSGYLLAQAAVIPLAGWLSDRFGARRIYLLSIVLFTVGSALCGLAPSAEFLIAARVFQGLGGGMLIPIGMAVLYRLTPPDRLGRVFGLFGLPLMVAPALGPVLSGFLLEYADWRLIFLINAPIGIAAFLIGRRVLPAIAAGRAAGSLDTLGVILGPLGFAALSYGITSSTTDGWTSRSTIGGLVVGVLALAAFVWRELSIDDPILDLRVFRLRQFRFAIVIQWIGIAAMFGTMFMVPLFLQQVRQLSAFETGLFMVPGAVASAIMMQIGGRTFDRLGVRWPVVGGMSLIVAGLALLSTVQSTSDGFSLILPLALTGGGMGSMMMVLNSHLMNSAPRALVGRVTSLQGALQNVVASLAIATFATLLQSQATAHADPAAAFGDVFRVALVLAILGWALAWALHSTPRAAAGHGDADRETAPDVHPEPVLV
jgi:EmrB/QacA subfamily drug resistance transporter